MSYPNWPPPTRWNPEDEAEITDLIDQIERGVLWNQAALEAEAKERGVTAVLCLRARQARLRKEQNESPS